MRAATRRRLRRWALLGASATIAVLVIAGLALSSYTGGAPAQPGSDALERGREVRVARGSDDSVGLLSFDRRASCRSLGK